MYYKFTISDGIDSEVVTIEANSYAQAWEFIMSMFDPFN
jgi:hypothetical protein